MGSPAKVLADLFQSVLNEGNATELFAVAAANNLGRDGSQSAIEVLARMLELIEDSHRLVALLNAIDAQKGLVGRFLAPLSPFAIFQCFTLCSEGRKGQFCSRPPFENLLILACNARWSIPSVKNFGRSAVRIGKLTAFMEHIHDSDLPEPVSEAFLARALQMLDILNHFEFFGEKNLQQKIDALLGQITVATAIARRVRLRFRQLPKQWSRSALGLFSKQLANGYLGLKTPSRKFSVCHPRTLRPGNNSPSPRKLLILHPLSARCCPAPVAAPCPPHRPRSCPRTIRHGRRLRRRGCGCRGGRGRSGRGR